MAEGAVRYFVIVVGKLQVGKGTLGAADALVGLRVTFAASGRGADFRELRVPVFDLRMTVDTFFMGGECADRA
jgi:hypothetical protein